MMKKILLLLFLTTLLPGCAGNGGKVDLGDFSNTEDQATVAVGTSSSPVSLDTNFENIQSNFTELYTADATQDTELLRLESVKLDEADADTLVSANSDVVANTAKVSYDSTTSARLINTSGTNTGDQTLPTVASLGLDNVDNTSDANKPVSTATQTALDAKEDNLTIGDFEDALEDVMVAGSNMTITRTGETLVFASSGTGGDFAWSTYPTYSDEGSAGDMAYNDTTLVIRNSTEWMRVATLVDDLGLSATPTTYTLDLTLAGVQTGDIVNVGGTDYTATSSITGLSGDVTVTETLVSDTLTWTGTDSGDAGTSPWTLTMDSDKALTGTFSDTATSSISYIGGAFDNYDTAALALTVAETINDGDYLIASVATEAVLSAVTWTPPTGWTLLSSITSDSHGQWVYGKVASSETGIYSFPFSGSATASGVIGVFRSNDTTATVGTAVTTFDDANGGSLETGSLTCGTTEMFVAAWGLDVNVAITSDDGMTEAVAALAATQGTSLFYTAGTGSAATKTSSWTTGSESTSVALCVIP